MRKQQAQLSFKDSFWVNGNDPVINRIMANREAVRQPLPSAKRRSVKVQCLECSRVFFTSTVIPSCPGCGGVDIDLA
jgi:hypothetical protein